MKLEEAKSVFDNCKIYVGTKSKEVQEKLFLLGFKWANHNPKMKSSPKHLDKPFLYVDNGSISYGEGYLNFKNNYLREVYVESILNTSITDTCRQFKTKEECIAEMKNHEFFGWVINKKTGIAVNMILIEEFVRFGNENVSFSELFKNYTFMDGSPVGVKY